MTPTEKAQADAEKVKKAHIQRIKAYRAVFGRPGQRTPAQQIVWNDLMSACHVNKSTMVPESDGSFSFERTAFAEGRRNLFLEIQGFTQVETPED